ncbi:hypothetical protein MHPYR_600002 [uncultured Mycobacterium sp.]|uniref:PD-(D/E)XK endonuclease-like domain-containing protein n=1 Tax=uncultured Mycobacterium sp. TaxID=171292 RepID=A0A1Y5PS50_9MYCO|nr:hypothetical protein MHPYR_600002 [uncultured Mycobacterium sp.]
MRSDFTAAVTKCGDREWLSPTRAWRLTECAASVGPVVNSSIAKTSDAPNAGTVAHRAVQLWIEADWYRDDDPRSRLTEAIATALREFNGEPIGEWTSTRARLLTRASQLAERLRMGDRVISEEELQDPDRALRGTPDIVVVGQNQAVVIDLKTPTTGDDLLPPWIIFQLTIYAYLVQRAYGVLPHEAAVFRLNRGFIPVTVSQSSVALALDVVEQAREADRSVATPGLETCRYCLRRFDCQAHWDAAACWSNSDCVEGTVEHVERSANGVTALRLQSADGSRWISGIPTELAAVRAGEGIRLVRLQRSQTADNRVEFKWSRHSALSVQRATSTDI